MARRRHRISWELPAAPVREVNRCRLLLVIDNRPLQAEAWGKLQRARKQLEKATRDLHRHEEKDEPAFRAWISTSFPTLVSAIREIARQVEAKRQVIDAVERESYFGGRSPGASGRSPAASRLNGQPKRRRKTSRGHDPKVLRMNPTGSSTKT